MGGMCATRCSGSTAVKYGSMRENVLNLTAVLADGTIIRTGSRARKSSAGYDITRLLIGSEGTLAVITEATLKVYPLDQISGHFHDTYGQALANTLAALQVGVWNFQSSVAGLGGCPYAKGATGNVATEDVVYMLHGMGIHTGIDLDKLVDAGAFISDFLGRKPNSNVAKAILNKRAG